MIKNKNAYNKVSVKFNSILNIEMDKLSKGAKIRNRYNQVPHLTHTWPRIPMGKFPKWTLWQTLLNGEDPDEMPQNVEFHLGLYCLLREKQYYSGKE